MTEKNGPHHKLFKDELSDDDPIIELTDEVVLEPGKGWKSVPKKNDEIFPENAADDSKYEHGDDIDADDENGKTEWQGSLFSETGASKSGDGAGFHEDEIVPPAYEAHIGSDEADEFGNDALDDDEIVIMDYGHDEVEDNIAAIIENDPIKMEGQETPHDPAKEIGLEFANEDEGLEFLTMDGHADDEDEIIATPSEPSPIFEEDVDDIDLMGDIELELDEGEEFLAASEELQEPPQFIELQQEDDRGVNQNDDLPNSGYDSPPMFNESAGIESEDDINLQADFDDDNVEIEEDITEITEFDQHFPEEDGEFLDPAHLKDKDFLELFELGEDSPPEDEELRELSESEEKAVEAELNRLLDDDPEDQDFFEQSASMPAAESSALNSDWAWTTSALASRGGKTDQPEEDEHLMEDLMGSNKTQSQSITPAQIDLAIERVIREKFADRIEQIIYEIIEKAVSKEIERLKGELLDGSSIDDDI